MLLVPKRYNIFLFGGHGAFRNGMKLEPTKKVIHSICPELLSTRSLGYARSQEAVVHYQPGPTCAQMVALSFLYLHHCLYFSLCDLLNQKWTLTITQYSNKYTSIHC
jgi:hypothetical protein